MHRTPFRLGCWALLVCVVVSAGCAAVADPRQADIFHYNERTTGEYLAAKQSEVDSMQQQRAQLDMQRQQLAQDVDDKSAQRDVLLAQIGEMDKSITRLEHSIRAGKARSAADAAHRRELESRIAALRQDMESCRQQPVQDDQQVAAMRRRLQQLRQKQDRLVREWDAGAE